jgi:hypothetical protein
VRHGENEVRLQALYKALINKLQLRNMYIRPSYNWSIMFNGRSPDLFSGTTVAGAKRLQRFSVW